MTLQSLNTSPNSASSSAVQNSVGLDEATPRWFAVYTLHKREKLVRKRLQEKQIEAYVPLLKYTRRYTRKIKHVELPLINGYVFVKIAKKDYVPVLETPDVLNFVRFSRQLVAIPEAEILILQRVTGEGIEVDTQPLDQFQPGDEVEIIAGNLTGLRGKLLEQQHKNFLIELTHLGLSLRIQVNAKMLLKVTG